VKSLGIALLQIAPFLAGCNAGPENGNATPPRQAILTPARPIPPGTAPRGTVEAMTRLAPPGPPPTMALLRQGREGYDAFCTPCHGRTGHGDGSVTRSGFPNPPSFHHDRLLEIEPARIVAVVSEGTGKMLPFAERIPPAERWAIAYYVKALQLSQRTPDAQPSDGPDRASGP
jgi:mono/diheme cytochrome c family protein